MLWVLLMSTHNICFYGDIRKHFYVDSPSFDPKMSFIHLSDEINFTAINKSFLKRAHRMCFCGEIKIIIWII